MKKEGDDDSSRAPLHDERRMTSANLNIRRIDSRREDIRAAMAELRTRLSPQGNVVSEAGRRRTIEVFGEPLSPQQVVERICCDVQQKGIAAVLDYSARIDKSQLTADALRVPAVGVGQRPRGSRSAVSRGGAARGAEHPRVSAGDSAPRRAAGSARRVSCSNSIGRWSAWASACRAGRRRILRRC